MYLKFRFYMYLKEGLYTWIFHAQCKFFFLRLNFLWCRLNRRISQKISSHRKIQLYGLPFTNGSFVLSLVEFGPLVLEKTKYRFIYFCYFIIFSSWKGWGPFIWTNLIWAFSSGEVKRSTQLPVHIIIKFYVKFLFLASDWLEENLED